MTELLAISTIKIIVARDSGRTVESIQLSTDRKGPLRDIQTTLRAGDVHQETFDPPLVVKSDDHICISAGSNPRSRKRFEVIVAIDLQNIEWVHESQEIKAYRKTTHVEVEIVCLPPDKLVPTTDELIRVCAKFRVLIIGNSGVGKSTLVRRMFGVVDVHASDIVRGEADINQEFTFDLNERFVVHDSLGFEAGDARNLEVVKDFVKRRQAMPRLEDQLHAIWLCVEIPYSGGRLVERGVEQLLKNQRDILGNIPLIVVLTKVDLLDIQLELEAHWQDNEPPESRRKRHLDKYCIEPLQRAAKRDVTCVAVSAMQGYYILISNLMEATQENMANNSIDKAPRAMAAVAQRVDVEEKIEMSIAVGKKQYWNSLLKSAVFCGRTLGECLEVIRKDIVTVWNLIDLDYDLLDEKLIKTLIPANISPSIMRTWLPLADERIFSDMFKDIGSTMSAILNLRYDSYKEAVLDVEIFMSYIVDLICVMQVIFLLAPDGPVTRDIVARAIEFSKDKREQVHESIRGFDKKRAVRAGGGQDLVLKEIEGLISRYRLSEQDMVKLWQDAAALTSNV